MEKGPSTKFCDILIIFHKVMKLQNPEFDVGDVSPANGHDVLSLILLLLLWWWWWLFFVFMFSLILRRKNFRLAFLISFHEVLDDFVCSQQR